MLNNADSQSLCNGLAEPISKLAPNAQLFRASREPMCLRSAETDECHDVSWIDGRKVLAFCGIGQPSSFFDTLSRLGALIVRQIVFTDHYRLTKSDITRIIDEARDSEAEVVVTTDKDLARLGEASGIPNLHTLVIRLEIEDSSRFAEYIANRIDGQDQSPAA
jgi:tetraacyldisaccharide 4'-kinase